MVDAKSKVLVVDDFELIRTMLKKTLADMGIKNVAEAADGEEAMNMMLTAAQENSPYEVIFADWNMPKMTGFELLKFARDYVSYKTIPFIMVTAEAERDYVIQALAAGATDYIVKPISVEGLRKKIDNINKRLQKAA